MINEGHTIYTCPFCPDRKGSPDTKGHFYYYGPENGYHCFRCGASRSKGPLPEALDGTSILDQHLDFRFEGETVTEKPAYHLRHARDAWKYLTARAYLDKRGINEKVAKASRMLYATSGPYAQRIIFPVLDWRIIVDKDAWRASIVYYVARTIIDREPKYINCPAGKNGWVYLVAGKDNKFIAPIILVVEGVFDAFAAARTGFPAAAIFGKRINAAQCKHLATIAKRAVVILDSDAFASAITVGHSLSYYMPTVRAELPPRMDPDKLVANHGAFALRGIVEKAIKVWDEEEAEDSGTKD